MSMHARAQYTYTHNIKEWLRSNEIDLMIPDVPYIQGAIPRDAGTSSFDHICGVKYFTGRMV